MGRPSFTVIIPLYNALSTIDATIRSVAEQTLGDVEVLVIDDRSTDGSYELAVDWARKDSRIRVHRMTENSGGPIRPRNEGLIRAEGRLLAFIDHDDRWLPRKLELQLMRHEEEDLALTYTRCIIEAPEDLRMDGSDYHEWWGLTPLEGRHLEELTRNNFVPVCTVSLRREWAQTVGPFSGVNGIDDWHYWLRLAAHGGRFGFIDKQLAVYRWTSTNLSNRGRVSPIARKTRTLQALAKEFPQYRKIFGSEERRVREKATEARMRRLPRPLRSMASQVLLPPRLWKS